MRQILKNRFKLAVFALSLTVVPLLYADPLSRNQVQRAKQIVMNASVRHHGQARSFFDTGKSLELLSVQRQFDKKNRHSNIALVYQYDYSSNELLISRVDLNSHQLISVLRERGIQLPLTSNEIKRARQIVFNDREERTHLENEFTRITEKKLQNEHQLSVKASVFKRDTLGSRANEATKSCGIDRCAQLMLSTHDGIRFEISPVINLSKGLVSQWVGQ